jgi:CheY-like chemotaxis protein
MEMETADGGQAAFDKYDASPVGYYDMILMDMQMPGMDGCEATERIRASERADAEDLPIIAMTAHVMKEDLQRAYESGMNAHIGKPIDFVKAYELISEILLRQGREETREKSSS